MLYLEVTVRWLILKQYLEVTVQNPITGMGAFFQIMGECGTKKYFTDHQAVNKIQSFVAIKGNFSGLFFI